MAVSSSCYVTTKWSLFKNSIFNCCFTILVNLSCVLRFQMKREGERERDDQNNWSEKTKRLTRSLLFRLTGISWVLCNNQKYAKQSDMMVWAVSRLTLRNWKFYFRKFVELNRVHESTSFFCLSSVSKCVDECSLRTTNQNKKKIYSYEVTSFFPDSASHSVMVKNQNWFYVPENL